MGSCFGQKTFAQIVQSQEFKTDQMMGAEVLKPMITSLYALVRKPQQLEIIRESPGDPILQGETQPHLSRIRTNDMKMLYNFKNILAIDDIPKSLQVLKQMVNLKSIYKITSFEAREFIQDYPIFAFKSNHPNKEHPTSIPLLVFHSQELLNEPSEKLILFLHSKKHENSVIYQKLQIDKIIYYTHENGENDESFIERFKKLKGGKVLLLHQEKIGGSQLLNILAESLSNKYSLSSYNCKSYLQRFFPSLSIIDENQEAFLAQSNNQIDENSLSEKYYKLLVHLHIQHSKVKEKTERAYSLLCTLITNIYSNLENSENYRKVKITNKQLYQSLGKFSSGRKILQEIGWKDQNGFWFNDVELNSKLLTADLKDKIDIEQKIVKQFLFQRLEKNQQYKLRGNSQEIQRILNKINILLKQRVFAQKHKFFDIQSKDCQTQQQIIEKVKQQVIGIINLFKSFMKILKLQRDQEKSFMLHSMETMRSIQILDQSTNLLEKCKIIKHPITGLNHEYKELKCVVILQNKMYRNDT